MEDVKLAMLGPKPCISPCWNLQNKSWNCRKNDSMLFVFSFRAAVRAAVVQRVQVQPHPSVVLSHPPDRMGTVRRTPQRTSCSTVAGKTLFKVRCACLSLTERRCADKIIFWRRLVSQRSLQDGGLWSLTLHNFLSTNGQEGSCVAALRRLYGSADRSAVFSSGGGLMSGKKKQAFLKTETLPSSLFPVSQSTLSTLQVIVTAMTDEHRETLITLATAGLIDWQENDGETPPPNNHRGGDTGRRTHLDLCYRCARVSGGAALLPTCRRGGGGGHREGGAGHSDGVEEQQRGLVSAQLVMWMF